MKVYWTTKDGTKLDVDDMSPEHIKNAFKMLLRNIEAKKEDKKARPYIIELNGDMAQQFNDAQDDYFFGDDCDDSYPY